VRAAQVLLELHTLLARSHTFSYSSYRGLCPRPHHGRCDAVIEMLYFYCTFLIVGAKLIALLPGIFFKIPHRSIR